MKRALLVTSLLAFTLAFASCSVNANSPSSESPSSSTLSSSDAPTIERNYFMDSQCDYGPQFSSFVVSLHEDGTSGFSWTEKEGASCSGSSLYHVEYGAEVAYSYQDLIVFDCYFGDSFGKFFTDAGWLTIHSQQSELRFQSYGVIIDEETEESLGYLSMVFSVAS